MWVSRTFFVLGSLATPHIIRRRSRRRTMRPAFMVSTTMRLNSVWVRVLRNP